MTEEKKEVEEKQEPVKVTTYVGNLISVTTVFGEQSCTLLVPGQSATYETLIDILHKMTEQVIEGKAVAEAAAENAKEEEVAEESEEIVESADLDEEIL